MWSKSVQLDNIPYSPYSFDMKRSSRQVSRGAEEARQQLPAILAAAAAGQTTVITRHGRAIAAVVPVAAAKQARPASLQALAGTGRGLWGKDSSKTVSKLRDEWNR
jgi:prevent-host-death family protein